MKKLFAKLMVATLTLGLFTACEDVPEPYTIKTAEPESGVYINETFATSLGSFTVYTEETEGYEWANSYSSAYISGYQNQVNKATKTWLISPSIDLSAADSVYVSFDYILRYKRTNTYELIRVSADYDGSNPTTATWYDLDITLTEGSDYTTFYNAQANLPAEVIGQAHVVLAFYYEAPETQASTWEVKNLVVRDGAAASGNNSGNTPEEGTYISEAFSSSFGVFSSYLINTSGYDWSINYSTAYISGYQNYTNKETESWLIAEPIDLTHSTGAYVAFDYVFRYKRSSCKELVRVSTNYDGNPATATWTDLDITLTEGSDYTTFYNAQANLPAEVIGQDNVVIALYYYAPETEASTWEVKNFTVKEGEASGGSGGGSGTAEGTGDGTVSDPYNVTRALAIINAGTYTSDKVYIQGIISQIDEISTSFGNATYYISDDGTTTTQLEVYRGYGLNGDKFTSESDIKVGDKVVVYGQLTLFYSTPEVTTGSSIYSLNGEGGGGSGGGSSTSGTGDGTYDSPYDVEAVQSFYNNGSVGTAFATGYIVGYVEGNGISSGAKFEAPSEAQTEILIAASADETDYTKCVPVQLPKGDIRTALDIYTYPELLGQTVILYGSIEKYFGVAGIKSTSYAEVNGNSYGAKPVKARDAHKQ